MWSELSIVLELRLTFGLMRALTEVLLVCRSILNQGEKGGIGVVEISFHEYKCAVGAYEEL